MKEKIGVTFFGQELTLNIENCDSEIIRSKEKLLEYIDKLCNLINMKKYGKPFAERFALHSNFAAGYSVSQMIETSLISGHFSELWKDILFWDVKDKSWS